MFPDICQPAVLAKRYVHQTAAFRKGIRPYMRQLTAFFKNDTGYSTEIIESIVFDRLNAFRYNYIADQFSAIDIQPSQPQACAIIGKFGNTANAAPTRNVSEIIYIIGRKSIPECIFPNIRDPAGDRYALQFTAPKRLFPYAFQSAVFAQIYEIKIATNIEGTTPDTRHTARNCDTRQTTATVERTIPDTLQLAVLAKHYARQIAAFRECIAADARHPAWNFNTRQTAAILEGTAPNACKLAVRIKRHARQTAAPRKCTSPYARHSLRNGDARQTAAVGECIVPDARHAARDLDTRQTVTSVKGEIFDICQQAIRVKRHAHQAAAIIKCGTPDARHAARNFDALQTATIIKCATLYTRQLAVLAKRHARQGTATRKRLPTNARQSAVFSKCYTRQTAAIIKCSASDAHNTARNGDTRQAAASVKCIIANACHVTRNLNTSQTTAIIKCTIPDAYHSARNFDIRQTAAIPEGRISNARQLTSRFKHNRNQICVTGKYPVDTGDCCRNYNFRNSVRDYHDLCFIFAVDHAIFCGKLRIIGIDPQIAQTAAPGKSIDPDVHYAIRKLDARQTAAVIKCIRPDVRYATRNIDTRQTATSGEGLVLNARHAARNRNARQTTAIIECPLLNDCPVAGKNDVLYPSHLINHIRIAVEVFRQGDGIFASHIGNQLINPIFHCKTEAIVGINIGGPVCLLFIYTIAFLIDQFLGIIGDITIFGTADGKHQIT